MERSELYYWTEFGFPRHGPLSDLHCTHKFLGNLPLMQVDKVVSILRHFFHHNDICKIKVEFDTPAMFGPNGEVQVLKIKPDHQVYMLLDLRLRLDHFHEDQYTPFIPHITTSMAPVLGVEFTHFRLRTKGRALFEYEFI
jgi:2'-5' RNA ligase